MPDTGLHFETELAVSHFALEVVVEAFDDQDDLLWDSICPEYAPETFSVYAVKGLLEIHKVDVQLPLPLCALLPYTSIIIVISDWGGEEVVGMEPYDIYASNCSETNVLNFGFIT